MLDFSRTSEQTMLADSTSRFLAQAFPATEKPLDAMKLASFPEVWTNVIANAALLAIAADEEVGGLGLGAVEAAIIAMESGRHSVPFALVDGMVAARFLAKAAPEVASELIAATSRVAIAWRHDLSVNESDKGDLVVSGSLTAVSDARFADWIFVVGRNENEPTFLVKAKDPAVSSQPIAGIDYGNALDNIEVEGYVVDQGNVVAVDQRDVTMFATVLFAAECVGIAETCLERVTVDFH